MKTRIEDEFLFNLDGLIDGEYVNIQTDSKVVLARIIELMDSPILPEGIGKSSYIIGKKALSHLRERN